VLLRSASLPHAALGSVPTCGARRLPAQPYQMRRATALSWFRRAAACESWRHGCRPCQARSHLRVAALGYCPCQARREATASLSYRATIAEPLPLANFICRRASIPQAARRCLWRNASVCFECFKCFRGTLQAYCTDVAKIDRDIAIVIYVYCKLLFSMFHLCFFRRMLQARLSGCCIYFHKYDASVLSRYCTCL
jgi:hypothetical protein